MRQLRKLATDLRGKEFDAAVDADSLLEQYVGSDGIGG